MADFSSLNNSLRSTKDFFLTILLERAAEAERIKRNPPDMGKVRRFLEMYADFTGR